MFSIVSGLALSPTMLSAGSPGNAFVRENVISVIPRISGMRNKSLLII
jgi:hypothetical protein